MGTFWGFVGGGLAAAILTIAWNMWWDRKKQELLEDWQFRLYHANQIHIAMLGLSDTYFSAKSEIYFISSTLETLLATLDALSTQADALVRSAGGPRLTVAELEQRKAELLQPFQKYNQEQVNLRWKQHEQKAQETMAKAETHISALQPLIPESLHGRILALYGQFSARWQWDLPHARDRLALFENNLPEFNRILEELRHQIEAKLGRIKHS